jgi:serine/threonine-protein kinase SRPK3
VADLQENNIFLGLEETNVLESFERAEREDPTLRKVFDGNTIYQSRELDFPKHYGRPVITDFGEARFGRSKYEGDIQPFQYRAPEVLFELPWNNKVDIWNVGALVCTPGLFVHDRY